MTALKAPFPYFGGKLPVAPEIWSRFGDVPNYVEPFAGSLAVLLARPKFTGFRTETVNDLDGFLVNAWRAIALAPDQTAKYADWPVSEADLEARHYWLITEGKTRLPALLSDPEGFDPKIAGWWVWGACCWIGSGWCSGNGPWRVGDGGVWEKIPDEERGAEGGGVCRKHPHLGNAGRGINRQLPHLGDAGQGVAPRNSLPIYDYFLALSERLSRVRICYGDFGRVLGESVTVRHGVTGVLLDPPYMAEREKVYRIETDAAHRCLSWCLENGDNPLYRIALCGYVGEHDDLIGAGWSSHAWKAVGGFGSQGKGLGRENANKERIWFSPYCLKPMQAELEL